MQKWEAFSYRDNIHFIIWNSTLQPERQIGAKWQIIFLLANIQILHVYPLVVHVSIISQLTCYKLFRDVCKCATCKLWPRWEERGDLKGALQRGFYRQMRLTIEENCKRPEQTGSSQWSNSLERRVQSKAAWLVESQTCRSPKV